MIQLHISIIPNIGKKVNKKSEKINAEVEMNREMYINQIIKMLERASDRKLYIIYRFILKLLPYKHKLRIGKTSKSKI